MKRYALIQPDEKGQPFRLLSDSDLEEILKSPEDWGIDQFVGIDSDHLAGVQGDPMYWPDGEAMLIEFEVVIPEPITSAWRLPS